MNHYDITLINHETGTTQSLYTLQKRSLPLHQPDLDGELDTLSGRGVTNYTIKLKRITEHAEEVLNTICKPLPAVLKKGI